VAGSRSGSSNGLRSGSGVVARLGSGSRSGSKGSSSIGAASSLPLVSCSSDSIEPLPGEMLEAAHMGLLLTFQEPRLETAFATAWPRPWQSSLDVLACVLALASLTGLLRGGLPPLSPHAALQSLPSPLLLALLAALLLPVAAVLALVAAQRATCGGKHGVLGMHLVSPSGRELVLCTLRLVKAAVAVARVLALLHGPGGKLIGRGSDEGHDNGSAAGLGFIGTLAALTGGGRGECVRLPGLALAVLPGTLAVCAESLLAQVRLALHVPVQWVCCVVLVLAAALAQHGGDARTLGLVVASQLLVALCVPTGVVYVVERRRRLAFLQRSK
jgi:hypothetical protein